MLVVAFLVGFACGQEVKPIEKKATSSESEPKQVVEAESLEAESRVIQSGGGFHPNLHPVYPHPTGQFGGFGAGGPGVLHPKGQEEKAKSSYAVIPDQPGKPSIHSPRFVENPAQNQLIETVSPVELQQLHAMQPHPMAMHPQAVQFPNHFGPGPAGPYMMNMMPFNQRPETATVRYEEDELGFMDRVYAVRRSTTEFFGSIPDMIRNFFNDIVSAVSNTARMFTGADDETDLVDTSSRMFGFNFYEMISDVTSRMYNIDVWESLSNAANTLLSYVDPETINLVSEATSRMVKSVDWVSAMNLLAEQLS